MGPRSIDRGIHGASPSVPESFAASMGPRSIDRGIRLMPRWLRSRRNALQWGRDQLIAESITAGVLTALLAELQWGRDQLIAAPLKLRQKRGQHASRDRFRDQLIAAPLKRVSP